MKTMKKSENDIDIFFDVSGMDDEKCGYSLVACNFEDWLSYYL